MSIDLAGIAMSALTIIVALASWGLKSWASRVEKDISSIRGELHELREKIDAKHDDSLKVVNGLAQTLHSRVTEVDREVTKLKTKISIFHKEDRP